MKINPIIFFVLGPLQILKKNKSNMRSCVYHITCTSMVTFPPANLLNSYHEKTLSLVNSIGPPLLSLSLQKRGMILACAIMWN